VAIRSWDLKRIFFAIVFSIVAVFCYSAAFADQGEPLTLEKAIALALDKNRGLIADTYDAQSAKWGTGASVSNYLPKVYFVSTWSRMDQQSIDDANAGVEAANELGIATDPVSWENMYRSYISVSQPIFNGGQEIAAIAAANAQRKERGFNALNSRYALIRDVKNSYYNVLAAQELLVVANESIDIAEESLKVAKTRHQIGQVNRSEVLRWEANRADAQVSRLEAENLLISAHLTLVNLLGVPMGTVFVLASGNQEKIVQDMASIDEDKFEAFPGAADVAAHPSVRQADETVALSKIDRFSSVGTILPRANFNYTYNWENNDTLDLDGGDNWTAGIQIEIPLFQSLGGVFKIGQSEKTVRKTQSNREDFIRGMLQQLYLAKLNMVFAKKRVLSAGKGQQFAKENLDLVSARNKLGMTSNLEQIDAKFAYTRARADYIRALSDFYKALADFEYLTSKTLK
jgi:outer membrane protein TolC